MEGVCMKSAVIVQARNGSTRYPQKMLCVLQGKTAIEWVLDRCNRIEVDYKILATSNRKSDDTLAAIARAKKWKVVRGDVDDVLERYAKAVRTYRLDTVVRITGDCVLTDGCVVNEALVRFHELRADYLSFSNMIDGFDVEVMSGRAILDAAMRAKLPSEREHVTPYIRKSKRFTVVTLPYGDEDLSSVHLSLDYEVDAEVLNYLLGRLGTDDFTYRDVVNLLKKEPQIMERTSHITPNEGYQKSLREDREFIRGLKGKPLVLKKTIAHFEKVKRLIPNCSQTFSKSYLQFSVGAAPLFVKEGKGCNLTDLDGNTFIDYTMGLGACILGYGFEPVTKDTYRHMRKGSAYTLPHYLEYELAELLTRMIPCAEMVRFGKNGSDVTSAAVRLARAYTGRDYIACCGYHGWQDWYIATTTRSKGIPEDVKKLTLTFQYNNVASLETLFEHYKNKIACVIMEPVSLEPPENDFLNKVKELTRTNGSLLVFDEVVTGFRFSMGGAQEFFGVIPDIACFGKAMGNGMPISAIVGRTELMRLFDEIFFSFTFGGETGSLAAALATIRYMSARRITKYLWKQGETLKRGIRQLIDEKGLDRMLSIDGYPVRMVLGFRGEERQGLKMKTLFQQECAKRGVLFTAGHNVALPHTDAVIKNTLRVYSEVMDILNYGLAYDMLDDLIEGSLLEPVFRRV